VQRIGLTAGASAPALLIDKVIEKLHNWGVETVSQQAGKQEKVVFALPKSLQ
jgi:4-hydroxy-3-methylbut-2-enyl diphosphate reductase